MPKERQRGKRAFGFKGQFEMTDDSVDCLQFIDKRDDFHPAADSVAEVPSHWNDSS